MGQETLPALMKNPPSGTHSNEECSFQLVNEIVFGNETMKPLMCQAFNVTAYRFCIFVISICGAANLNYCLETLGLQKTFDE